MARAPPDGSIRPTKSAQPIVVLASGALAPKEIVNEMIDRSTVAVPAKSGPQIWSDTPREMLTVNEVNSRSTVNETPR